MRRLALVLAALLPGCWGYRTLTDTPGRIRSTAVEAFQNRTLYTGLEFDLQEALVKEIQAKSAIAVVPAGVADAALEGRIVDFSRSILKQDPDGRDVEFQILLTAEFSLRERRTGKLLFDRHPVNASGTFLLIHGETEANARARAMSRLAEKIVNVIVLHW